MSFNGRDAFLEGSDTALPKAGEPSTIFLWQHTQRLISRPLRAWEKSGQGRPRIACQPGDFVGTGDAPASRVFLRFFGRVLNGPSAARQRKMHWRLKAAASAT